MRHLVSLVLSIILAPLIYIAAGYSAVKVDAAHAAAGIDWGAAALGVVAGLIAGALYAVLVMARLSPFGPVVAGLIYLGLTLWALLDASGFASVMPDRLLGVDNVLLAPVGAGTLLLAVPLLFTIFSPRRWRRSAEPGPTAYQAAPAYPTTVPSAAPAYEDTTLTPTPYQPPVYHPAPAEPVTEAQGAPVGSTSEEPTLS